MEREREVTFATSAMDFCRDALLSITKMAAGQLSVAATEKELAAVLRRVEGKHYKSVLNVKDDVLNVWRTCLRLSCSPLLFSFASCLHLAV